MIINQKDTFNSVKMLSNSYDVVSPYNGDPFVGHLATPISNSTLTKSYLNQLPAYKEGLSPLLRGISIGCVHGYFLLGPFVKLGPLRDSQVANFIGFMATLGLIVILTAALVIYGYVTFSNKTNSESKKESIDFLSAKGWGEFTSGFTTGGFGGSGIAYLILQFFPISN